MSRWVNEGGGYINLETERERMKEKETTRQRRSGTHFWGRLCLNQGCEAPAGSHGPRNVLL